MQESNSSIVLRKVGRGLNVCLKLFIIVIIACPFYWMVSTSLQDYIEALRDAIDPALPLGLGEVPYGPLQVMHLQADTSTLQEDTGWRPATPFEEGIRETIEWVRNETK